MCSGRFWKRNLLVYSALAVSQVLPVPLRVLFIPNRASSVVPLSQDVLLKLYNTLQTKEKKLYGNTVLPIDRFDVMFLVQSIFHQRSILSGKSIAGSRLVGCGSTSSLT